MSKKQLKYKNGYALADAYTERIKECIRGAYSEGYSGGAEDEREKIKNLRGTHKREAGEHDDSYAKDWRDDTSSWKVRR